MEKGELIIITAKEIFIKLFTSSLSAGSATFDSNLKELDKAFKAITKTVTDSCLIAGGK
jgi:hypothetical protein